MVDEHPIQGLMTTTMENLKEMIDVNTIVGDPVETPDGSIIIPVSKLGFGFAAGGTEFNNSDAGMGDESGEATLPFGGGSGGGVSVTPIAFLIVNSKGVKMVHLNENVHIYEKMIDFAPKAVEKIQQIIKESSNKQTEPQTEKQAEMKRKPTRKQHKEVKEHHADYEDYDEDGWDSNYI